MKTLISLKKQSSELFWRLNHFFSLRSINFINNLVFFGLKFLIENAGMFQVHSLLCLGNIVITVTIIFLAGLASCPNTLIEFHRTSCPTSDFGVTEKRSPDFSLNRFENFSLKSSHNT